MTFPDGPNCHFREGVLVPADSSSTLDLADAVQTRRAQLVLFPDGCSNRHFRKEVLVPAGSASTLDLAGAVAVVAVAPHTFRRRIRNICRSVGEDSFYKKDMGEHHAVDLPWMSNGPNLASEYDQDQRNGYEPHMLL